MNHSLLNCQSNQFCSLLPKQHKSLTLLVLCHFDQLYFSVNFLPYFFCISQFQCLHWKQPVQYPLTHSCTLHNKMKSLRSSMTKDNHIFLLSKFCKNFDASSDNSTFLLTNKINSANDSASRGKRHYSKYYSMFKTTNTRIHAHFQDLQK